MRYGHLVFYAAVLALAYVLVRPGAAGGRAVVSVSGSMADVLGGAM